MNSQQSIKRRTYSDGRIIERFVDGTEPRTHPSGMAIERYTDGTGWYSFIDEHGQEQPGTIGRVFFSADEWQANPNIEDRH